MTKEKNTPEAIFGSGEFLEGSVLEAYVKVRRVLFPRVGEGIEIIPGQFGILAVSLGQVLSGQVPREFDKSWGGVPTLGMVEFVVKGTIPLIKRDQVYYFKGLLIKDKKFGFQYEIQQMHRLIRLETLEQKITFLRAMIGNNKTDLLLAEFPDPTVILDAEDVDALTAIKGIGNITATKIIAQYRDNLDRSNEVVQLDRFGLTPSALTNLQNKFKSIDAIEYILEKNPYITIGRVPGFGWIRADKIALNNGFQPNGKERIRAYIQYYFREIAKGDGHSWVMLDELVNAILELAPTLDLDVLKEWLVEWTTEQEDVSPWLYYERNTNRIGLMYYRKLEEKIAEELLRLLNADIEMFSREEADRAIEKYEGKVGYEFTEEQREAIYACIENPVTLITGAAGTGKTSIMGPVTEFFESKRISFAQAALSGKAGSNLAEITGREGFTIHRLLGVRSEDDLTAQAREKIGHKAIILDELSLVGGEIFLKLVSSIESGARLIMLGDPQQLEAIGLANLLKDLLDSGTIPSVRLLKIHRQAARSGIILESLRVSAGEQIVPMQPIDEIRGELKDLRIVTYLDKEESQPRALEEYVRMYESGIHPKDIVIVTALRTSGSASSLALNKEVQKIVNGIPKHNDIVIHPENPKNIEGLSTDDKESYVLREGDKILVGKNNYKTLNTSNEVTPIFNGNSGFIKKIVEEDHMIVTLIQQGDVVIPRKDFSAIELGYAMTCHRCQGSQALNVIYVLDCTAYTLLSKEHIYTSLTRAKKYCVFFAEIRAIRKAVTVSKTRVKHTWLQEIMINRSEEIYQDGYEEKEFEDIKKYLFMSEDLMTVAKLSKQTVESIASFEED